MTDYIFTISVHQTTNHRYEKNSSNYPNISNNKIQPQLFPIQNTPPLKSLN